MRVTLRPTIASDFAQLIDVPLPNRVMAITAELDGRVIGVGGFRFTPDGVVAAFVLMAQEARRYPVAIHRAGLRAMAQARAADIRRIVALAQPDNPAAERWLARLGFIPVDQGGETVWLWENK